MMSLAQSGELVRPDSSNLIHHRFNSGPSLSSNNPFRNKNTSLNSNEIGDLISSFPKRSNSRNPFLDDSEIEQDSSKSSDNKKMSNSRESKSSNSINGDLAKIFDSLTTETKINEPKGKNMRYETESTKMATSSSSIPSDRENKPPRNPTMHRQFKSTGENTLKENSSMKMTTSQDTKDSTKSSNPSQRSPEKKSRRNSDPSATKHLSKPTDPEAEKRRQERKRRELKKREENSSKIRKPSRKLDVIDKLDVTSIYGTGLFHHDGPFDACNPHRNREGSKRAPMQAFPKDSLNNVLGGGGPINPRPDHALFLGQKDEEAFNDYAKGGSSYSEHDPYNNASHYSDHRRQDPDVLSATTRVEPIHGEETLGLGTSTFLEGAPASRNAMQRRASESLSVAPNLPRSKSFAQKFRGINVPRRDMNSRLNGSDGASSPEARTSAVGRTERASNPILDFSTKEENSSPTKKEANVTIVEPEKYTPGTRTGSIPRLGVTFDNQSTNVTNGDNSGKSGFMSRVKSLKGGSRKIKTSPIES